MPVSAPTPAPVRNRLLRALPAADYARLQPHLQPISLPLSEVLCEAGGTMRHAYFIVRGIASLLSTTTDGATVEIGMVGNEGMVGLPILLRGDDPSLPYRVVIQLEGEALRVRLDVLREEFNRHGALHDLLLRFLHPLILQLTQSGVCNHYHTIEERLCRWLLISHDHAESDTIQLTQEIIAHMLGARRTGVSLVAGTLQTAGLISYRRGKITILNREGLEAAACECYRMVKDGYDQFFGG
jgi:CRP-like cAMP-binding protein